MLTFIDKPGAIAVFRMEKAKTGARRSKLGFIAKHKLQISDTLRQVLTDDELSEVEFVVDRYRKTKDTELQLRLLQLPETLREVVSFVNSGAANSFERQILEDALADALRSIRRQFPPEAASEEKRGG